MLTYRKINNDERNLIIQLLKQAGGLNNYKIPEYGYNLNDGNMGSIRLKSSNSIESSRKFSKSIADLTYRDLDGIQVVVNLDIDNDNNLYELDIWKSDFTKLLSYPETL